jgi:membrane protein
MTLTERARRAGSVGLEAWRRAQAVDAFLAAAGVAFFALLSLVPALGALIAVYGLFADPADVAEQVADVFGDDSGPGRAWILDQLERLTSTSSTSLTLAALVGLVVALWSASSGVRHLLDALDMAFGVPRASLVRSRIRGLAGVVVLVVGAAVLVAVLGVAPDLDARVAWVRYVLVLAMVVAGCALLYRPGGARGLAPPGAVVATAGWALGSIGMTAYVTLGPDLQDTYGAFGSVVALMLWLWICGLAVLAGAHVTAVLRDRPAPT